MNSLTQSEHDHLIIIIIARAKRGLTIRKQPSFVPGPRSKGELRFRPITAFVDV